MIIGLALLVHGCTKSVQEELMVECSLSGSINDEAWCGQVFEIFQDEQNFLVINASRDLDKNDSNFDQITIYVPEFHGEGTYDLQAEGGVYREWCCGDTFLELWILNPAVNDSGQVIIEDFDQQTGEIRGSFHFTASKTEQMLISGNFFGTKE